LDKLLQQSVTIGDNDKRDRIYQQIAKYVSDHALAAFGLAIPYASIAVKGVSGPGLTTKLPVGLGLYPIWSEVQHR
jgi:peptide/nickel transport system substrate-binding protein